MTNQPAKQSHYRVMKELYPSVYRSIGKICFKFACVEDLLSNIIYMLARIDRRIGRMVVKAPAAPEMVDLINDLLIASELELEPMTAALRQLIQQTTSDRNLLAHGVWIWSERDGQPKIATIRGKSTMAPPGTKPLKRVMVPEGTTMPDKRLREIEASLESAYTQVYAYGELVMEALGITRDALRAPPLAGTGKVVKKGE